MSDSGIKLNVVGREHHPHYSKRIAERARPATAGSRNARTKQTKDRIGVPVRIGGSDMNNDFKRGLYVGMGVLVAVYVFGLATGVLKKVF